MIIFRQEQLDRYRVRLTHIGFWRKPVKLREDVRQFAFHPTALRLRDDRDAELTKRNHPQIRIARLVRIGAPRDSWIVDPESEALLRAEPDFEATPELEAMQMHGRPNA